MLLERRSHRSSTHIPLGGRSMLYGAYHFYQKTMKPLNLYSKAIGKVGSFEYLPLNRTRVGRRSLAGAEMVERIARDYPRPPFPFEHTVIDGRRVAVTR